MQKFKEWHSAMFILALGPLLLWGQSGGGSGKCPPVKARNKYEALQMEAASNKKGCWVRDKQTGQLYFISSQAPDKDYKPLTAPAKKTTPVPTPKRQSSPPSIMPPNPILSHLILGTWRGSWCGFDMGTMQISGINTTLSVTFSVPNILYSRGTPGYRTCQQVAPEIVDQTIVRASGHGTFDGHSLSIALANGNQSATATCEFSVSKLVCQMPPDDYGEFTDPVVYQKGP